MRDLLTLFVQNKMNDSTFRLFVLSHSIALRLVELNLPPLSIAFTSSTLIIRPLAAFILFLLLWHLISNCFERTQNVFWTTVLGGTSVSCFMQYIETALLSQWNYECADPINAAVCAPKGEGRNVRSTRWQRLKFGFYAAFSFRCCGTAYYMRSRKYHLSPPNGQAMCQHHRNFFFGR